MQPPGIAEVLPQTTWIHHIPGCEYEGTTLRGADGCVCRMGGRDLQAQAYINHGRWIADCTRRHCANAEALTPGQTFLHCTNCQQMAPVLWPSDPDAITEALAVRPVPQTRNWAPAGHRQAVSSGFPEGQTVAELVAETHEHDQEGGA